MKKIFFSTLSLFTLSLMFSLDFDNEELTRNVAMADGTCCFEWQSNCDGLLYNHYLKASGPCSTKPVIEDEITP